MGVEEIIAKLPLLTREELAQVRAALQKLERASEPVEVSDEARRRAEEAWQRLGEGWCHTGGKDIAGTIDEALYGDAHHQAVPEEGEGDES